MISNYLISFICGFIWVVPSFYAGRISAYNKVMKEIEKIRKEIYNMKFGNIGDEEE